jgi:chemotaxis protein methyltransferase CheR
MSSSGEGVVLSGVVTTTGFSLSDDQFDYIRKLVTDHAAIRLPDTKRQMVYGRLVRRLRELKLGSFDEYIDMLERDTGEEFVNLVNAITTNLTSFFRENHHFELLRNQYLPDIVERRGATRRLRVWSAGCSTGEEPYTIAIVLNEFLPPEETWDVRILATDIDTNVVKTAEQGVYSIDRVKDLKTEIKRNWFRRGKGANRDMVKVRSKLQEMISFRSLNLMKGWPMKGKFDIIFCRNVVIYFDKPTQKRLFERYAELLHDDGYLFLGHSESTHNLSDRFRLLGNTVYQKIH